MSKDAILYVLHEIARLQLWKSNSVQRGIMRAIAEAEIIVLPDKRIKCGFCIDPKDSLFQQIISQDEETLPEPDDGLISLPSSYSEDPLVVQALRKAGMASLEIFSCFYRAACIVEKKKDPSKGRLLCNYLVNYYGRLNSAWFPMNGSSFLL